MSIKVIHFQSIFLIDFYLKKTNLCAKMWNNSPNCYAAGNSRERGYCSRRSRKYLSRTDTTGRRRLQQERCTRIKGPDVVLLDSNENSYQGRDHKTPVATEEQLKVERAGRDRNSKTGYHKLMKKKT